MQFMLFSTLMLSASLSFPIHVTHDKVKALMEGGSLSASLAKEHPDIAQRLSDLAKAYGSGRTSAFDNVVAGDFRGEMYDKAKRSMVPVSRKKFLSDYYEILAPPHRDKAPIRQYALQKVFLSSDKKTAAIIVLQGGQNWLRGGGGESTLAVLKQVWKRRNPASKWMLSQETRSDLGMKAQGFQDDWDYVFQSGNAKYGFNWIKA